VSDEQVEDMILLLAELGLNANDLDDLVVNEKMAEAAVTNSEGSSSQLEYLIGVLSEEELEKVLRQCVPGITKMEFNSE
jgi:hypothetical protein